MAETGAGKTGTPETAADVAGSSDGALGRASFARLIAIHRAAQRTYLVSAVVLAVFGLVLLLLTLPDIVPDLFGLIGGLMSMALAALPWKQSLERGERIQGLQVLSDEWAEMHTRGTASSAESDRFMELLNKLYDRA